MKSRETGGDLAYLVFELISQTMRRFPVDKHRPAWWQFYNTMEETWKLLKEKLDEN